VNQQEQIEFLDVQRQQWQNNTMLALFKHFRTNGQIVKRLIDSAESAQKPFDIIGTLSMKITNDDLIGLRQLFGVGEHPTILMLGSSDGIELRLMPMAEADKMIKAQHERRAQVPVEAVRKAISTRK
jgi:hypothetical protein